MDPVGFSLPPSMNKMKPGGHSGGTARSARQFQSAPGVQGVAFSWVKGTSYREMMKCILMNGQPKTCKRTT